MRTTVCRICLRSDFERTEHIDERLADFHDELCDYDVLQNDCLKFCSICEHLLRKFYNFKRKCRRAHKILKQKRKNIEDLQNLMPLSSIGFSTAADRQQIYNILPFEVSDLPPHLAFENITHYNLVTADENNVATTHKNEIDIISTQTSCIQGNNEEILKNGDFIDDNDGFKTEYLDLEYDEPISNNDYEEPASYNDYDIQMSENDDEKPFFDNSDEKQLPKIINIEIVETERRPKLKLGKNMETGLISVEYLKLLNKSAISKVDKEAAATKSSPSVSCDKCGATFDSRDTLQIHVRQRHEGKCVIYQCRYQDCVESFDSPELLREHTLEGHVGPPTRQQGPQKTTAVPKGGREPPAGRPSRPRVTGPDKPYRTCPVCQEQVANTSCTALYAHHMESHPKVPYAAAREHCYLCDQCGKSFAILCVYKDHLNTHSGAKPYGCSDCEARFHTKRSLYLHSQRHRPPTHQCKECGKMFPTSSNLNLHRRTHIGDRRFKCAICSKGFLHRASVKEHIDGVHNHIRKIKNPPKTTLKQAEDRNGECDRTKMVYR